MMTPARLALLVLLVVAFHRPAHAQIEAPRDRFARAVALYSSGNPEPAEELFREATAADFPLADYSLYYLGMIAVKQSRWDQARQYFSQMHEHYPQSIWAEPAKLQMAKTDIAEGKFPQANEALRHLRSNKAVKREIVDEAHYLQAQIQENLGNPRAAHKLYLELREASPNSRWTALARRNQSRLRDEYPELFGFHTFQSLAEEADRLVRERQYNDAEVLFKKLLYNAPDPQSQLRYLSKLSALYLSTRNRTAAMPILERIAREFPDRTEAALALYQFGQILWNRHDNAQALEYFKEVLEKYPTSAYADRAQFASADIHEYFGRKDRAIELYASLGKRFPRSQVRGDAGWRLAWLHYRSGQWSRAASAFRELGAQSGDGSFALPSLYWRARIAEKMEELAAAEKLYRQIVSRGDESYYYSLSLSALERLGGPAENNKRTKPVATNEPDPPLGPELAFHLARARELASVSLHRMAVAELDALQRSAPTQTSLRHLLMREYFANQAYGPSLRLAGQLPVNQHERDLYRYPLAFWRLIQAKAQERGLDPYLVLALIRQESLFDARARSPAAAFGLMQLISPTAARVAQQVGLPAPSPEELFDPDLNVTLGTEYLKDLLQRYSNNWFKAIAAYNAGEAAVDRWEREIVADDIDEFVERIPYSETRGYVKLVMRNHGIYKRLYDAPR